MKLDLQMKVSEVPQYFVFGSSGRTRDFIPFSKLLEIRSEVLAKNVRHITGIKVDERLFVEMDLMIYFW